MFGELIGKLAALPVRVINAPFRVIDKTCDKILNIEDDGSPRISDTGEDVAESIEETITEMFD